MKKKYIAPMLEVEEFVLSNSVMTTSEGLEYGDTDIPIGGEF